MHKEGKTEGAGPDIITREQIYRKIESNESPEIPDRGGGRHQNSQASLRAERKIRERKKQGQQTFD